MKQTFKQFLMEEEIPTFGKATERGSSISRRELQNGKFIEEVDRHRMGGGVVEITYRVMKPYYEMVAGPKKVLREVGYEFTDEVDYS